MEKYDVEVNEEGDVRYYKKGTYQLHRLDGPAVEHPNGSKAWYQNGELHRLDGPAVEYANGGNEWHKNGKLHRLDGPAVEYADGDIEWHIDGVQYIEAQFNTEISGLNTEEMTLDEFEKLLEHKIKIVK